MVTRDRALQAPKSHFFLFGPRGTGKSIWTRKTFPDAVHIDLLDADVYREFAPRPERLRESLASIEKPSVIIIDEVQKLPALLEVAHQLISKGTQHQFVFTGSSARKLRRGDVNLLGGRAVPRAMHPYVAEEVGDEFDIQDAMRNGMVPLVFEAQEKNDALDAYTSLYIREEVYAEGLVRNAEPFARFVEAISYSQGSLLNLNNVSRECGVSRKSVENYLGILEDLMLAYQVPVFTKQSRRQLVSHSKFYFFDAGVYRSLRPAGPLDNPGEIDGILLETLVAQHLRSRCDYLRQDTKLYYWRTKSGSEVDFVMYGPHEFTAYEVKNSVRADSKDLRALRAFKADYPQCKCTLLYRGRESLMIDGILVLPLTDWFKRVLSTAASTSSAPLS